MTVLRIKPVAQGILLTVLSCGFISAQERPAGRKETIPATGLYGTASQKFDTYSVILKPDKDEAEWWAGAPSVVRDRKGIFWMACRMRTAESPRGLRGYEIRILKSADGIHFEKVLSIRREDVPIPGFERPALLVDPETGLFKLYACGPWKEGPWSVIRFDDAVTPADFKAKTARPVIEPGKVTREREITVTDYKDPVILFALGKYHAFVTGYIRRLERIFHFTSCDGENWEPEGDRNTAVMPLAGWHDFFVRPASVLPLGIGYLFLYEGSCAGWYDPVYNIVTGAGFTFDLNRIMDLTPDAPLAVSSTPGRFHTFRYSQWMWVDQELWVYAEVACPNDAFEIRLFRLQVAQEKPG